jgi:aspartate 1-decarboxylase
MLIQVLKSKLKEVIVTDANTEYEGSITLDPELMYAANLYPYERVEVNAKNGSARIVTYVIRGKEGSGQVELNGGAANFFKKGDKVHVNCFAFFEEMELPHCSNIPIVKTDENNKVI